MRKCERGITYDKVCDKKASFVRTVTIRDWKDGKPGAVVGERQEYLCDEHGKYHQKMGQQIKKLHVIPLA